MSKVIVARLANGTSPSALNIELYIALLETAFIALSGRKNVNEAVRQYLPHGVIGMKTNCLARDLNSTPPALARALGNLLVKSGIEDNNIIIWDRTNHELQSAGFELNASSFGRRCLGTDSQGVGYSYDFYRYGKVNSLVSRILTNILDHNINLPILKDHSIAGLSGGLKNMYGAINNPNKYHADNCNPFAAHVSCLDPIKGKNRLSVIDADRVQFHGGPGFDSRYLAAFGGVIISDDPVAADRIGLEIIEHFRRNNKLPSLADSGRPVRYLETAASLGLGTAELKNIEVETYLVNGRGEAKKGALF